MGREDAPKVRHSVRVLLLDGHDRLLLFRGVEPETRKPFWFPAGGGLEDGEDVEDAACREIREETGLTAFELGDEVWRRRHIFEWRGVRWDQRERWFVARVESFQPDARGHTDEEKVDLTAARWWSPQELAATGDDLVPRDLASLLRELIENGPPSEPIEVGV